MKCHRENCVVCKSLKGKGKSKFNQMNVVYEAKCELCMNQFEAGLRKKEEIGIYIGESSRNCHERTNGHVTCAQSGDEKCFWLKHWANSNFE